MHDRAVAELAEESAPGHVEQVLGSKQAGPCGLVLVLPQDQIDDGLRHRPVAWFQANHAKVAISRARRSSRRGTRRSEKEAPGTRQQQLVRYTP